MRGNFLALFSLALLTKTIFSAWLKSRKGTSSEGLIFLFLNRVQPNRFPNLEMPRRSNYTLKKKKETGKKVINWGERVGNN